VSRASGRVVSRRDRPLEEVFCFTLLFLLCLLLLLLDDDDDDDDEKCARKEIQGIGIRGGFLKALGFFAQSVTQQQKDTENTLYSKRSLSTEDESSISNIKLTRAITLSFLLRQTIKTDKADERSILDAPPSSERRAPRTEATET
jgi:hypothetical protein